MTDGRTDRIAMAYTRYSIYAVARKKLEVLHLMRVFMANDKLCSCTQIKRQRINLADNGAVQCLMIDDHDRCEWVNVSSGIGSPALSRTKFIET